MRNYTAFLAALAIFVVTNLTWYFIISAKYSTPHPYIDTRSQYPLKLADQDQLPELSPRPDSIFFVETSGKSRLDPKEMCSVESAAKNNTIPQLALQARRRPHLRFRIEIERHLGGGYNSEKQILRLAL